MIVAVVVTYSAPPGMLDRCVDALIACGGIDRVIVVDTGDSRLVDRDGVQHLRVTNRGYGAAANLGAARARESGADAIVLLNDDVIVRPGWVEPLEVELHGRVGAVQPLLVTGDRVNSAGVTIGRDGAGVDVGRGDPIADGSAHDIELFTAGAVLLSAEFLAETGGFDERYFLYYEDVDLGRRGAARGWTYRVAPASVVEHIGGVSTGSDPDRTRYLQERNRLLAAFRFADAVTIGRALWLSIRRLRRVPRGVHLRALSAGVAGAPRRLWERRRS